MMKRIWERGGCHDSHHHHRCRQPAAQRPRRAAAPADAGRARAQHRDLRDHRARAGRAAAAPPSLGGVLRGARRDAGGLRRPGLAPGQGRGVRVHPAGPGARLPQRQSRLPLPDHHRARSGAGVLPAAGRRGDHAAPGHGHGAGGGGTPRPGGAAGRMTDTRPYHSPARQARRQHTRQAIIDAFIAQLGDPGRAVLSPAAAARAAGVSIRTVHHYFPDADAQLAAVAAEVEARLFPQPPPLPHTPAELPDLVTAVYHGSEGQLPLLRALVTSSIGPQIRARRRARRLEAIKNVLEGIGAGQAETRRAVAVVSLLASADAGVVLADQYGLTLPEAGQASAETTRAIIDRLSAQATRPKTHTTADPISSTGDPPAANPGSNR